MSDIKLAWLADELMAAGLNVFQNPGWRTHTSENNSGREYNPVAILNHHTAGSSILYNYPDEPYWPPDRLKNSCNITIRPDGRVDVLNAGYAWDSGQGDPLVLARVLADEPVESPADAEQRSRITGNPHFIDIEVQHKGDGGPIADVQYDALIRTNAVILNHYGWDPKSRLIGHREWTVRKPDPRWGGFSNPMPQIRKDTEEVEMVTRQSKADDGAPWLADNFNELVEAGVFSENTQPGGVTFNDEFGTFLLRFEDFIVEKYGLREPGPGSPGGPDNPATPE